MLFVPVSRLIIWLSNLIVTRFSRWRWDYQIAFRGLLVRDDLIYRRRFLKYSDRCWSLIGSNRRSLKSLNERGIFIWLSWLLRRGCRRVRCWTCRRLKVERSTLLLIPIWTFTVRSRRKWIRSNTGSTSSCCVVVATLITIIVLVSVRSSRSLLLLCSCSFRYIFFLLSLCLGIITATIRVIVIIELTPKLTPHVYCSRLSRLRWPWEVKRKRGTVVIWRTENTAVTTLGCRSWRSRVRCRITKNLALVCTSHYVTRVIIRSINSPLLLLDCSCGSRSYTIISCSGCIWRLSLTSTEFRILLSTTLCSSSLRRSSTNAATDERRATKRKGIRSSGRVRGVARSVIWVTSISAVVLSSTVSIQEWTVAWVSRAKNWPTCHGCLCSVTLWSWSG